jgi:hypothetical protein
MAVAKGGEATCNQLMRSWREEEWTDGTPDRPWPQNYNTQHRHGHFTTEMPTDSTICINYISM